MKEIQFNANQNIYQTHFLNLETKKNFKMENFPSDLIEAINDTRERKNLHGPFKTASEAVASMLEE